MRILYLSPDYGIPVLGKKGGAVHIRSMVAAFARAGHEVVVVAPRATGSPWEAPAELAGRLVVLPASDAANDPFRTLAAHLQRQGLTDSVARELRRMLYDAELAPALVRMFGDDPPDFIYSRAALFSAAAVVLAQGIRRPLLLELNAPLAAEQASYRGGALRA